jgi:hypothetical protein
MEEIIYFEVDNWFSGRDYPPIEPFISWMGNDLHLTLADDAWAKENKICVKAKMVDMSVAFCVTAPRSWVEKVCPELLSDKEYTYDIIYSGSIRKTHKEKFSNFLRHPKSNGIVYGRVGGGWEFLEYKEENFGVTWEPDEDDYEDENEEDDE